MSVLTLRLYGNWRSVISVLKPVSVQTMRLVFLLIVKSLSLIGIVGSVCILTQEEGYAYLKKESRGVFR